MTLRRSQTRARSLQPLIAAGLLFGSATAGAEMVSCRDANGKPLLQNSAQGCVTSICVIKPNGAKECEETKEERLQREEDEKRDKECQEKRHRSMLQELALLDKFSKRKDIDDQRDRELAKNAQALNEANRAQDSTRVALQRLNSEADFYRPKRPLPSELSADIAFKTQRLDDLAAQIAGLQAEATRINQRYDQLLKHYDRVLKGIFEQVPCDGAQTR